MQVYGVFLALGLSLASSVAFASGTPTINCSTDQENFQVQFTLIRGDETLSAVLPDNDYDDSAHFVMQDDRNSPSANIGTKDKGIDSEDPATGVLMPKGTSGFYNAVVLKPRNEARKILPVVIESFVVAGQTYVDHKLEFNLQIFVTSRETMTERNPVMKGKMIFVATNKTYGTDKKPVNFKKPVAVTCTYEFD